MASFRTIRALPLLLLSAGLWGPSWCASFSLAPRRLLSRSIPDLPYFYYNWEEDTWREAAQTKATSSSHSEIAVAGGPSSRVIYLGDEYTCCAGLDDRLQMLKMALELATSLHASLAVPPPKLLLGGGDRDGGPGHGVTTAAWWDEFVESSPRLWRYEEARCAAGVPLTRATDPAFVDQLPVDVRRDLLDASRPLCLRLDFRLLQIMPDNPPFSADAPREWDLVMAGRRHVVMWKSKHILDLGRQARDENSELWGRYNVAHVRRGDMLDFEGKQGTCTAVDAVLGKMNAMDKSLPWLIMTDAEKQWSSDLMTKARASGLKVLLESDLPALARLDDNFARYAALQCLFTGAEHALGTPKSHWMNCVNTSIAKLPDFQWLCPWE